MSNLKTAKEKYKIGDTYLSASGLLKSKLTVDSKPFYGEANPDSIYCLSGLLFCAETETWAINLTHRL